MQYPWQYDETIQVGVDYMDEKEVDAYDERMQALRNISQEVEEIRSALNLYSDAVVLEIGAGTAEFALGIASHSRHVHAVDISPAMLSFARRKAADRKITNVSFHSGGFLSGFEPQEPVEAIVSQLALHHLPDFWKTIALRRMREWLKDGGRLYLRDVVYPSDVEDYASFFASVIDGIRSAAGDEMARETIEHIKKEFSTLDWIFEGMIERAGFRIVRKNAQDFLTAYLCEK